MITRVGNSFTSFKEDDIEWGGKWISITQPMMLASQLQYHRHEGNILLIKLLNLSVLANFESCM